VTNRKFKASEWENAVSIADLLKRAKISIEAGENHWRQAAEDIASASEQGATQRDIAETVGKSLGWVNRLLQWRTAGYPATPFGPQSKAKRERADHVQAPEHQKPASAKEQAEMSKAQAEAATAKANAAKAKAEAYTARAQARKAKAERDRAAQEHLRDIFSKARRPKEIHSSDRTLLIKALGMLGSNQDGERLAAAGMVEKLRKKLGMDWEELIVKATAESQQKAAA
jgi:hypothetical protein